MKRNDRRQAWLRLLIVAAGVVILDQATKQIATAAIERSERVEVIFGVELANVRNKGVAFGLLAGDATSVLVLTLGALALVLAYFAFNPGRPGLSVAVGLLVGGALGNLADRLRIDAVIDFVDLPLWPAFNLADVSIVGGVLGLVLVLMEGSKGRHERSS